MKLSFEQKRATFRRQWPDTRPTEECKPCYGINDLKNTCDISWSPAYWWANGGCPKKGRRI